jgi:hypothetical protein
MSLWETHHIQTLVVSNAVVDAADDSDQKILTLGLWPGRIQAAHMDVVGEIMAFFTGKGEEDYRCGLCQVEWRLHVWGKRGRILFLGNFYIILNLEVGRKSVSLPNSNGLWARERIWADSSTHLC